MADIAKKAGVVPDELALDGVSRLMSFLWQQVWKHADDTTGGDGKALHDMRVAIRRLRSLLQNSEGEKKSPVLSASLRREFNDRRRELGKIGDALGAVRDHDVLDKYLKDYAKTRLKADLDAQPQEYSGLLCFERYLQDERATAFAPMVKGINKSRRPGRLQEEFARWALGLPAANAPASTLREIAHSLLAIRLDEIDSHAHALEESQAEEEQHELRKSLRRLRYTFETLAPCYAADVTPHIKQLVELQDLLGEMQDRTVLQEKVLDALKIDSDPASTLDAETLAKLPPDVAAFLKYGANRRARLLGQVRVLWKKLQVENFFTDMRAL